MAISDNVSGLQRGSKSAALRLPCRSASWRVAIPASSSGHPHDLRRRRTVGEIATLLGVSRQTLHRVIVGDVSISADMAARIGKLVGNGARIWLAMQADYDAWEATHRLERELKQIPTIA